jgi:predicted trehalose synthase
MKQRIKQRISLKDRLSSFAKEIREKASRLPPGAEREAMLKRASRADTAAHLDDWINSSGLRTPE